MSLSIGIVGLPNVGKSTLFNALTKNHALAANYPFATIEPNVGIVGVPDERLAKLGALYPDAPIVPADVRFTDIAGLVAGASKGEGLGNKFLANIRETSAIAHVVRAFADPNVLHVDTNNDPAHDIEIINTELILADLETLEKRRQNFQKTAKSDPKLKPDLDYMQNLLQHLGEGEMITNIVQDKELSEAKIQAETENFVQQLLTAKPMLYVFNVDEETLQNQSRKTELSQLVAPSNAVFICAQIESELRDLDASEATEYLAELGQVESGLTNLIQTSYQTLGLQSFYTAGDKEVRAWTVPKAATAPQAAGVIHTDFERGFIAAEVINWEDLIAAGSRSVARTSGKLRTEGKTYQMQDGDVVEFRFNV